ncbi:uncharacterized protein LOC143293457 isoform X2 [Babylonia areolata]|uniref:uncharacterized protein LOC143293457 isoform X2 n=1 Tax=Babylonia areolata TaxID=304850 RepID=UPI003FD39F1C
MERAAAGGGGKADFFATFHHLCSRLLSPVERHVLQQALQAYRVTGQVRDLVENTSGLWAAPSKLQLLPFVRQVVSLPDRPYFDALLGIHEGHFVRGPRSDLSKASSLSSSKSGNHPMGTRGGIHVIKIGSSASPRMGFSVRGGSEFGLGIFVSHVDPDSPAERGGLKCGDQVLESNGVDLEAASSQRAEELLTRTHSHTLVVRRTRKIPEWKVTKERLLWYDVATRKLRALPSGEATAAGSEEREGRERKVVLKLTRDTDFVGLNIRGGKDFGLGVYVSRVDPGGVAERAGVEVGDRVVQVNKQRLDSVSHADVVQLLRSNKHLVLTLWAVGRFPAYKELFTEYVWSDVRDIDDHSAPPASASSVTLSAELHPEPRVKARHRTGRVTQRTKTRESRVDRTTTRDSGIDLNGVDLTHAQLHHPDPDYDDVDDDGEVPVQQELFYPRDQDIIFRGNYAPTWQQLDKAYGAGDDTASTVNSGEPRAGSSGVYSGRTLSAADNRHSASSSEEDMDYTTFLERKTRRDVQKASVAKRQQRPAVAEEAAVSAQNSRETARKPDSSQPPASGVRVVSATGTDTAEPALLAATAGREPLQQEATSRVEASTSTTTDLEQSTSFIKAEKKAEDKPEETSDPTLVKTVIRVDANNGPRPGYREIQTQSSLELYTASAVVDRREDTQTAAEQTRQEPTRHQVTQEGDIYAVVTKPPRQQLKQQQTSGPITTTPTTSALPVSSGRRRHTEDADSRSSSSDEEHSDDDSEEDSDDSANAGRGGRHHHRTHIYHINRSPTMSRKGHYEDPVIPVLPYTTSTSTGHHPTTAHRTRAVPTPPPTAAHGDDNFVVVTEVLNEVAFQPPSPTTLDFGKSSSIASSTSNSDSTVSGGEEEEERRSKKGAGGAGRRREGEGRRQGEVEGGSVEALSEEIRKLEARQSSIGSREIFYLADTPGQADDKEKPQKTEEERKVGKWSALKKRLTSSMRLKKKDKRPAGFPSAEEDMDTVSMSSIRKKGIFERSFGSQMMNQQTEEKYNLMMVEERARHLLDKDESDAVLRHLKTYQEQKDLDRLVEMLMAILDRPDKLQLLKDIRGVVLPSHVGRFDSLVARHELTSFDSTSSKLHLPLSPVHRSESRGKPRPKFMTTVIDADGHFHIQSVDHEQRDRQRQIQVVDAFRSHDKNQTPTYSNNNNYNNNNNNYNYNSYNTNPPPPQPSHYHQQQQQLQKQQQQQQQQMMMMKRPNYNNTTPTLPQTSHYHQQQQQQQQQQMVHRPITVSSNNRSSAFRPPPSSSSRVNGVDHQNRLNSNVTLPPPPEWRDDVEVIIVEKAPVPPPPSPPPPEEGFVVYLSKQKKNLGLIVCGGAGDHMDSSVRIEMVMPWGAAADDERIQSGMHILSVDDQSVRGLTQSEAIALLKRCFTDVRSVNMKLRLKKP